jgi:hypothetical protein
MLCGYLRVVFNNLQGLIEPFQPAEHEALSPQAVAGLASIFQPYAYGVRYLPVVVDEWILHSTTLETAAWKQEAPL